ncbi:MAG: CocE/NonD family hydrolase [bacterium]
MITDEPVIMRDGVKLTCNVYLPPDDARAYPVVLLLSPYDVTSGHLPAAMKWAGHGFAFVCADCRGRFKSGGNFTPWVNEQDDAYALLEWIQGQSWCDGNIGMVGGSYAGFTQLAAAASRHPALKAIAPSAIQNDLYSVYYTHGVLTLAFMLAWHVGMTQRKSEGTLLPDWPELLKKTPLSSLDDEAGIPCPSWKEIVAHDGRDNYWKEKTSKIRFRDTEVGVFLQNSWFDHIGSKVFTFFSEIINSPGIASTPRQKYSCLRIGPWGHGVNVKEGELDYGPAALVTEDHEIDFLTCLLKGQVPESAGNPSPLQIFVMGENKWRFENEWPLKRTNWTPFYLGGNGHANTASGDGRLSRFKLDGNECPPDIFISDPQNPVPTCGGRGVGNAGQRDQSDIENRQDVLVYTLPPLEQPMEVTGPVSVTLFAAASTPDADFAVKLVDVYPDGRPYNVCDGIMRARFRGGIEKEPQLMNPGTVYEFSFEVDVTAYVFMQGHGVRLEIAGSNFPHYSRNPNTGRTAGDEAELQESVQMVYHSREYPSRLILPVIPQDADRDRSTSSSAG